MVQRTTTKIISENPPVFMQNRKLEFQFDFRHAFRINAKKSSERKNSFQPSIFADASCKVTTSAGYMYRGLMGDKRSIFSVVDKC